MENPFLHTLRLPVITPPSIKVLVFVVHMVSFFLTWITGLDLWLKLLVTCLTALSLVYYLNSNLYRIDKQKVSELILGSDDRWTVKMKNGHAYPASLGPTQFVHPYLTIVSLICDEKTRFYIFTTEILNKDLFRRLRVRLRYKLNHEAALLK